MSPDPRTMIDRVVVPSCSKGFFASGTPGRGRSVERSPGSQRQRSLSYQVRDGVAGEPTTTCSVMATHELLIKAELATPEEREYLNRMRIVLSRHVVSRAGSPNRESRHATLHVRLFAIDQDEVLPTLVHQMAILLSRNLYGGRAHGQPSKQPVRLDYKPLQCHCLDVTTLKLSSPLPASQDRGRCTQLPSA